MFRIPRGKAKYYRTAIIYGNSGVDYRNRFVTGNIMEFKKSILSNMWKRINK